MPDQLLLSLKATVLEYESMHIRLEGMGTLGEFDFQMETEGLVEVFVGEFHSQELEENLRRFAVMALDAAQRQIVFPNTKVLVIVPENPKC